MRPASSRSFPHIGLNALAVGIAGARSYLERMLTDFPACSPSMQVTAFVPPNTAAPGTLPPNVDLVEVATSGVRRLLWEQFMLPIEAHRRGIDVLYTFSAIDVFLAPCPTVIRIGNMAPYSNQAAEQTHLAERLRFLGLRTLSKVSARTADGILVMSDFAAQDLVAEHGFPVEKTVGINRGVSVESIQGGVLPWQIHERYIVTVGHLWRYKKILEVIEGYGLAKERFAELPKLVIVGPERNRDYGGQIRQRITRLGLESDVMLKGAINRRCLFELLSRAHVAIFSSIVETFPVGLMEMMLAGCALIVADRSVMPRFCGDAALYYDPDVPQELSAQLSRYMQEPELVAEMRFKVRARVSALQVDWHQAVARRYEYFASLALERCKR